MVNFLLWYFYDTQDITFFELSPLWVLREYRYWGRGGRELLNECGTRLHMKFLKWKERLRGIKVQWVAKNGKICQLGEKCWQKLIKSLRICHFLVISHYQCLRKLRLLGCNWTPTFAFCPFSVNMNLKQCPNNSRLVFSSLLFKASSYSIFIYRSS